MKEFYLYLPNGKGIKIKGKTYEDLLQNIDIVFDEVKDSVTYYLGCDDNTVIKKLKYEEIDIEEIEE